MENELMDLFWTAGTAVSGLLLLCGAYLALDERFRFAAALKRAITPIAAPWRSRRSPSP